MWGWPFECVDLRVPLRAPSLRERWGKGCIFRKDSEPFAELLPGARYCSRCALQERWLFFPKEHRAEELPHPIPCCFGQIKIAVSFLFEEWE